MDETLVLGFASAPDGRVRAEALIADLLAKHDLGQITGGGQDIQSGAFDIEIRTSNGVELFEKINAALDAVPGLKLENATLVEAG